MQGTASVSALATTAEADAEIVRRSRFFVDHREAALAAAGDLRQAIAAGLVNESHNCAEVGEVLLGRAAGRQSEADITDY